MSGHALGTAVGLLLDRALGEPPDAWHPVAWFGTAMQHVEQRLYADNRVRGTAHAAIGAGTGLLAGVVLVRVCDLAPVPRPLGRVVATALAVGVASSGRMLRNTSQDIQQLLAQEDLAGARERVTWLVGRDPSGLDASGIASAVVESLAENTVDAVVAPVFWALVAGAPGVLAHRAVNTMDAMVGHHSERYERYGWAAARLDDLMAWVPARIMAGVVAVVSCLTPDAPGPQAVLRIVRRDAPAHPSPNAGVAESAAAAALGVRLGGPLHYGSRFEDRPVLGEGPRPTAHTISSARSLVDAVEWALVAGTLASALASHQPEREEPP
ncbi:adenosylcobinamide-phosphate synthase CbiB [Ornithinimicrobium faecis]|uniref:Cobalamin biosynthesis protein CobD n=1 Tax=Ornithinimicrobium faecis TaxID=2934158 RepID=A0ABY4YX04_9MICO|nr:adenosylcobinamide-phosphate synthase CbiB [Ornithinimicrobium sp. HY1793]USQ81313.1 adenosylcobinamide-phosphate synthase CbiB [Ornithinimicrobium sp. HY1793]